MTRKFYLTSFTIQNTTIKLETSYSITDFNIMTFLFSTLRILLFISLNPYTRTFKRNNILTSIFCIIWAILLWNTIFTIISTSKHKILTLLMILIHNTCIFTIFYFTLFINPNTLSIKIPILNTSLFNSCWWTRYIINTSLTICNTTNKKLLTI